VITWIIPHVKKNSLSTFTSTRHLLIPARTLHSRYHPTRYSFEYPIFYFGINLDEFDNVIRKNNGNGVRQWGGLLGWNTWALFSILEKDYLSPSNISNVSNVSPVPNSISKDSISSVTNKALGSSEHDTVTSTPTTTKVDLNGTMDMAEKRKSTISTHAKSSSSLTIEKKNSTETSQNIMEISSSLIKKGFKRKVLNHLESMVWFISFICVDVSSVFHFQLE